VGTHEALMEKAGQYSELYNIQAEAYLKRSSSSAEANPAPTADPAPVGEA
jgi:hypothetical protein